MKRYISRATWVDLTDGHAYRDGDPFPHDGRAIPDERLESLSGPENDTGTPLITAVEVPEKKPKEKK